MLLIEQTTVPLSALPVAEFKDHLRLGTGFADDSLQDAVLETCLRSAVAAIEGRTGKALIERQFLQTVTGWRGVDWHPIPIAPVTGIYSLSILDRAGTPVVVDPETYGLEKDLSVPRLTTLGCLPTIPRGGSAEIVFDAGYGTDWTAMPDDLLRAVHILAADLYDYRNGRSKEGGALPAAVDLLIDRYRPVRIVGGRV